jgi:hypothetical protein
MQNGILLWAVMGASSTTGTGPYTHAITPVAAIPSFTMQHEATGTATAWSTQVTGCKVAALSLSCSLEHEFLIAHVDWIGKKATDPAFQLANDPALPATATTGVYPFTGMTRTFDGAAIDGLTALEFTISPDLSPIFSHSWDAGTYTGMWLHQLLEGARKEYELKMTVVPASDDMWDELVAQGNTKNIVLKWAKSANDYIQLTLTDCHFLSHPTTTPQPGQAHTVEIGVEVERLAVEVKDTIAKTSYGEAA